MKAFLIIEDNPNVPGGISINVMHQPTQAEVDAGIDTKTTVAGMMLSEAVAHINELVDTANTLAADVRRRHAEQAAKAGKRSCLH